jgi:hypothetical protein
VSLTGGEKAWRLQKALECGGTQTHRLDDVVRMLKAGEARLFENEGGVIVAEIITFPLLKTVNFWLLAGELRDILALEDDVLDWATAHGCTIANAVGRPGWGRVAAPTGWKPWLPNFYKPLGVPDGT